MKRLIVRLTIVGVVLVVGVIAIAQVQRERVAETTQEGEKTAKEKEPTQKSSPRDKTPKPLLVNEDESHSPLAPPPENGLRDEGLNVAYQGTVVRGNGDGDVESRESPTPPPAGYGASAVATGGMYDPDPVAPPAQPGASYSIGDRQSTPPAPTYHPTQPDSPTQSPYSPGGTAYNPGVPAYGAAPPSYGYETVQQPAPVQTETTQPPTSPSAGDGLSADSAPPPADGGPYAPQVPDPIAAADQDGAGSAPAAQDPPATRPLTPLAQQPARIGASLNDVTPYSQPSPSPSSLPAYQQAAPIAQPQALPPDAEPEQVASQVSALPGDQRLEGAQQPSITIHKKAPPEIQVGRPAQFQIIVRNEGHVAARQVTVMDQVPQGTRLVDASPEFSRLGTDVLVWNLETLEPSEERTITVNLMPETEGYIGSVAQVLLQAQASVRTRCTRPQLEIAQSAPSQVLIGQDVTLSITISNPGTGAATGVVLEEDVPEGLVHPAGNALEYEIGTLRPGESQKLDLTLKADKAGIAENLLVVRGDGNLVAEERLQIEVIAPRLEISVVAPSKRYLQRQVTYDVSIANPGSAVASNIELVAHLPNGLEFVDTNQEGRYDQQTHTLRWRLPELAPQRANNIQITALPIETGAQEIRVEGTGNLGLAASTNHTITVDELSELQFTIADIADPIEVGSDTTYVVELANRGSKADANVRLVAVLPQQMQPLEGDGPTQGELQGQTVVFQPLARLAPNSKVAYRIRARGVQAGDQRIRVQLVSDEAPTPVTKEEITRVYLDQ